MSWKVQIHWSPEADSCPFQALAGCSTAKDPPSPEGFQILALKHLQKKNVSFHKLHPFMTDVSSHLTILSPTHTPWFIPFTEALKRHATSPKAYISWPKGKKRSRTSWPKIRDAGGASSLKNSNPWQHDVATKKIERLIISWSPKWQNACKITYPAYPSYEKNPPTASVCCPSVRIDVHTHRDRFTPRCDTRSTGNKLRVAELIRSMWAF